MRNSLLVFLWLSWQTVSAQIPAYPFDLPSYGFIHYNNNRFELVVDNPGFSSLFARFDTLLRTGNNQIRIVHLGGSHIQADVYTHRMRQELQSFYPGVLGSRGFFFPYSLAHTNSPSNLKITYSGDWLTSKNTQAVPAHTLGISGITSVLNSTTGAFTIVARYDSANRYDFNRIRIFCNTSESGIVPEIFPGKSLTNVAVQVMPGYVQYDLDQYTDSLSVLIMQGDSVARPFQLYGISLENDDPGVVYNAIGVNGAKLQSYLRCGLFTQHLKALDPDWVILSIGTNDANTRQFDEAAYRAEYQQLLDSVTSATPNAAILLTVPNDCYLFKRYTNPNTSRMREIIYDIARSNYCGVWDFYTVMGGLNSSKAWYNNGLMNKDHIHFNKPGYLLKGDLFFTAFLKSWEDYLQLVAAKSKQSNAELHSLYPRSRPANGHTEYLIPGISPSLKDTAEEASN